MTRRAVLHARITCVCDRALPRAPPGCPCVDDLALLPPATENLGKLSCWLVLLLLGSSSVYMLARCLEPTYYNWLPHLVISSGSRCSVLMVLIVIRCCSGYCCCRSSARGMCHLEPTYYGC